VRLDSVTASSHVRVVHVWTYAVVANVCLRRRVKRKDIVVNGTESTSSELSAKSSYHLGDCEFVRSC
jgi:hypothetical protein